MPVNPRKAVAAIFIFLVLLSSPGCLGRMVLSSNVREFNMSVVEGKWGREILFVGFYIIPVYSTGAFLDLFTGPSVLFKSTQVRNTRCRIDG